MNPEYDKQLETRIGRELNALGNLSAPPALANRVLRRIEQRHAAPWYRHAWQTWPAALQATSLAALVVLFGGICFGAVWLMPAANAASAAVHAKPWFATAILIWTTTGVLSDALAMSLRHLSPGVLGACGLLLATAYAACLGLGTLYVRIGMARR